MDTELTAQSWVALTIFAATVAVCIRPVTFKVPVNLTSNKSKPARTLTLSLATAPPLAILILLAAQTASLEDLKYGIIGGDGAIVPYSILLLVLSLALLCIGIDETGLFRAVAWKVANRKKADARGLFRDFFLLSTVLTVLTSNDVVVLTVTPILIYFTKGAKLDPVPYLISGFWVCNIASMALYIGNPSNVIVAQANNINVLEYTKLMGLPTLVALLIAYGASLALFWRRIPAQMESPSLDAAEYVISDVFGAWFGSILLGISLILLMTMPLFVDVAVWVLTLPFALLLLLRVLLLDLISLRETRHQVKVSVEIPPVHNSSASAATPDASNDQLVNQDNETSLLNSATALKDQMARFPRTTSILSRLPYNLIPFNLGMFILVETLTSRGWTSLLARGLAAVSYSRASTILAIGGIATLACNALNNLPMTILFSRALAHPLYLRGVAAFTGDVARRQKEAQFALVVGSNLGANVLFMGSLAGIMWVDLVVTRWKVEGITQGRFLAWCLFVTPFVLLGACGALIGEMSVEGF